MIYTTSRKYKDKIVPAELILNSGNFRKQCLGMKQAQGLGPHLRDRFDKGGNGKFFVLEDNLQSLRRVLHGRERRVTKRTFRAVC